MEVHAYIAYADNARPLSLGKESSDVVYRLDSELSKVVEVSEKPFRRSFLDGTGAVEDKALLNPTQDSSVENPSPALSYISAGSDSGWQWHQEWGVPDSGEVLSDHNEITRGDSGWKSDWGWSSGVGKEAEWPGNQLQLDERSQGRAVSSNGHQVSTLARISALKIHPKGRQ